MVAEPEGGGYLEGVGQGLQPPEHLVLTELAELLQQLLHGVLQPLVEIVLLENLN